MIIIKQRTIREQGERYPDAADALAAWLEDAQSADWATPADLKARHPSASVLPDSRFVFNVKGNHYRLIVAIFFPGRVVYIKFFGTHADYDRVDAATVDDF